jgi:hypothetical protein
MSCKCRVVELVVQTVVLVEWSNRKQTRPDAVRASGGPPPPTRPAQTSEARTGRGSRLGHRRALMCNDRQASPSPTRPQPQPNRTSENRLWAFLCHAKPQTPESALAFAYVYICLGFIHASRFAFLRFRALYIPGDRTGPDASVVVAGRARGTGTRLATRAPRALIRIRDASYCINPFRTQ